MNAWLLNHSIFNYTPQKSVERDNKLFDVPELSFDLKLHKSDMSPPQRDPDSFPLWAFLTEDINWNKEGWGILINTFYELDSSRIYHIRSLTRKPIWRIGPIVPYSLPLFSTIRWPIEELLTTGERQRISMRRIACGRWIFGLYNLSCLCVWGANLSWTTSKYVRWLRA